MKFKNDRPFATSEAAERKLLELANAVEPDHAGRLSVAVINKQFRDAGGSYEEYRAALAARGLDEAPFVSYLDAFRYGMPPHGGFALGLERFVAQVVGVGNVRETTLFPRDRSRLLP